MEEVLEALRISHEESQIAKEELKSVNEELQSTNEELATSKEELQSMNEALQTFNAELQSKVQDLTHEHNDLANLLNSTEIAVNFFWAAKCECEDLPPMRQICLVWYPSILAGLYPISLRILTIICFKTIRKRFCESLCFVKSR